jgi:hypothetical protein
MEFVTALGGFGPEAADCFGGCLLNQTKAFLKIQAGKPLCVDSQFVNERPVCAFLLRLYALDYGKLNVVKARGAYRRLIPRPSLCPLPLDF